MIKNLKSYKYYLLFVFQFGLLLFNARFDPDPHHDGLIFAGAVASSGDLTPNKDFFAQYGPLTPYIQGRFLHFTSDTLLDLRLLMAFLLAMNGILLFHIFYRLRGFAVGLIVTLIWVLELSARIPWPSILSTSILMIAFLFLLDFSSGTVDVNSKTSRIVSAGFLLGVTPFIRIHNLLIIALIIFMIPFVQRKRSFIRLSLSYIAGLCVGLIILVFNGGLHEFIIQCVIWPLERYAKPDISKSYLVGILWYPAISLLTFAYLIYIYNFFVLRGISFMSSHFFKFVMFWTTIGVGLLLPRDGYLSLRNPKIVFIDSSYNFLHFIGYASAGVCIFYASKLIIGKKRFDIDFLTSIFALCSLSQLYPLYDQVHLWFVTPLLLACALIFLRNIHLSKNALNVLAAGMIPVIILLSYLVVIDWAKPRVPYSSPILSGLWGESSSVFNIDSTISMLQKQVGDSKMKFVCPNGLYAAFDGVYRNSNADYVNWSPGYENPKKGEYYFVCDLPEDQFSSLHYRDSLLAEYHYSSNGDLFYSAIFQSK